MLRFFVSVTLPSILVMTVAVSIFSVWVTRRLERYRAQRRIIQDQHDAIRQAQDALAAVISDSLTSGSVREQAVPAYEALSRLLPERERKVR
jgi:hypothetical protein